MYKEKIDKRVPSIKELRKICKKENYAAPWRIKALWSVSIYITKLFLYLRVTSIQINFLMTIMGLIGILFFLKGEYLTNVIGLLLVHFSTLLDTVDGEVGRFRKETSGKSGYLDLMSHIIVFPLVLVGISIGTYWNNKTQLLSQFFLISGLVGAYFLIMINMVRLKKYESCLKKKNFKALISEAKSLSKKRDPPDIKCEIKSLFGIGQIFNLLFFFTIFNILPYLLLVYGIVCPLVFLKNFYYALKKID